MQRKKKKNQKNEQGVWRKNNGEKDKYGYNSRENRSVYTGIHEYAFNIEEFEVNIARPGTTIG